MSLWLGRRNGQQGGQWDLRLAASGFGDSMARQDSARARPGRLAAPPSAFSQTCRYRLQHCCMVPSLADRLVHPVASLSPDGPCQTSLAVRIVMAFSPSATVAAVQADTRWNDENKSAAFPDQVIIALLCERFEISGT